MGGNNYSLSGDINLAVSVSHADKLLRLGDGNCALLYLYALRKSGSFSASDAARDLKRTQSEIEKAAGVLRAQGLFSADAGSAPLPLPADELPEYTALDIARRSKDTGDFPAVVEETQKILGKTLTGADIKTLFGLYDYLKLPAEVILLLLNHCVESARERSGPGRLPSLKTIEKEAYIWFNREIMTLEQAEDYLRAKKAMAELTTEIKQILQINGRNFSPTERQYVESWLEMGFDSEAIGLAYDRTVVKTGGLQWKYMNSILSSWNAKDLHRVDEIQRGDSKSPAPVKTAVRDDSELFRKKLDKLGGK